MADYGIDINVNMGGSQGNFQTLIDSINQLNANFQKVGDAATNAGNRSKQSFADSMNIINKYGGSVKAATANIDKWKARIEELNRLNNTGAISQTKYNSQINTAATAIKRIETATRQYNRVLGQTVSTSKSAQSSFAGLTKTLNTLAGVMGTSFGLFGAFMVLKNAIKTIADFDLAQKKLRSILGETEVGMESLSKAAIKIGESSIFGASKVTDLQIALAKMGFVRGDIDNMTQSIVNFATALQEDLGQSAEVVANVLRAFQMDSSETGRVVDVMTKAFNTSALSLDNFRESIKYVAPVAKQAGFSFEETTSALALLANVGLKGSLAGTGLNNVLKAMMDSNSKLSKSLGGTVQGYEGFISVLKKARDEGWSSEKIFGLITQRATAAFTTMVKGVDKIEEYRLQLYKAMGTAEKQSAIQMDTIANKAKLAGNAFGAMVLKLDSGSGAISTLIKGILVSFTDLVTASEGAVDAFKSQRKAVYDLNKDIVPLIDRYDELKKITPLTKEEQAELELIILKVTDAIPGAVKGFDRYGEALDLNAKKAREFIEDQILLMKYLNAEAIKKAQSELDKVNSKIGIARRFYEELLRTGEIIDTEKRGGYLQDKVIRRKATQEEIADAKAKFQKLEEQQRTYLAVIAELNGDAMLEELKLRKKASEQAAEQAKKDEETSAAVKRLEDEKKIAQERIKLKYDGDQQIRKIAQSTADFDKRIAELSITNEDEYARAITLINLKLANDLKGIRTKSSLDALKIEQSRNETLLQGLGDGFDKEQALMKSNYEYGLKILEQTEKGNENIKEKIADYNEKYFLKMEDAERKHAIEVLKIREELNQLNIQIKFEGYEENLKLRESAMKSEIDILVERNLATEEHNKEYEKIQLKYKALTVKDEVAFQKELTQLVYEGEILRGEIEGNSLNIRREAINKWFDFELSKLDKNAVNFDQAMKNLVAQKELKFKELEQGKSLYELLFPDAGGAELAAMEESVGIITDNISKIADSWVDATDKIVDQLNRQIDETQSALEVEAELMAAGYANNVSLKKKELEDLKAARKTALDEQRKAQQAEVAIDTITQISSLITASAQIIKGFSKIPVVGVGLGIAAVTLMLGSFAAAKVKAYQTAGISKFAEGGWIGGKSHRDGGTHIEAEKGEYVINKRSAFKHKELIEAINGDNKYEINKVYLNNLKGQIVNARVSLDDSKELKSIRKLLEEKGKTVEYINGYRIERVGNVTTKIRLN